MTTKYWNATDKTVTGYSVHWEWENENGSRDNNTASNCYAGATLYVIAPVRKAIVLIESMHRIPYEETEIRRWIADLNEIGFPCHIDGDIDDKVTIKLILSEYQSKLHLSSTLMLIRVLWECQMNQIPDYYFQAMMLTNSRFGIHVY